MKINEENVSNNSLFEVRKQKLGRLKEKGVNPYPHNYKRSHTSMEAIKLLENIESDEDASTKPNVAIAGRLMNVRDMGKVTFVDVQDISGQIQILLRKNLLETDYDLISDLDIGDWIGVSGAVIRTRRGEPSVEANNLVILCKSLRPLPEKWHGLTDTELRFRHRHLDLIANDQARLVARTRPQIVSSMRRYLDNTGFIEVETPVLVPIAAGAMARPFITHHNQLRRDLYMRIATELYLKRLVVGGLEKVYEIGKVFRNEGVDLNHNPEFTMLECYEALADYHDMMDMVENMIAQISRDVLKTNIITIKEENVDLTEPWPRLSLREQLIEHTGVDFIECGNLDSLKAKMNKLGLDTSQQTSWSGLLDKLISDTVEPKLIRPSFLIDYPVEMSPLAKKSRIDERIVERFEGFIGGMEICNSFTELNDPIDQRERFEYQESMRTSSGSKNEDDYDRLDEDFLVAIEQGMPPTAGLGMGIDRLTMILLNEPSIREVILFPQLRSNQ
ncbi:MAG: lysine--tRNA ligase [Dehalococcoidia bacterium]|nr:lysine--tRNA ligase [Dehalococcoidia bacterium]MQG15975.1 lysine--tRNA ligase [SAR202 cluster bacterium]|tara:strand:- start:28487 stop:29995 length:1509 start_codon:yes stop_codon:yes gene_type:complete